MVKVRIVNNECEEDRLIAEIDEAGVLGERDRVVINTAHLKCAVAEGINGTCVYVNDRCVYDSRQETR